MYSIIEWMSVLFLGNVLVTEVAMVTAMCVAVSPIICTKLIIRFHKLVSAVVFALAVITDGTHTHIPAVVIRSNAFLCITFNRFFVLV